MIKYLIGIVTGFVINATAIFIFEKSAILSIYITAMLYIVMALGAILLMKKFHLTDEGFTVAYVIGTALAFVYYNIALDVFPKVLLSITGGVY